ncbi:MAG: glycosyltransferase family 2 protein [Bacteroidia bacterium]|nr:glycosyltransferase family 2 protein [Bacteroidia bacterium]
MTGTEKKPLISVAISAYNHNLFIRRAIEGVLMQEVNFPYELILIDDASTDKTPEILTSYQQQYPERIRLLLLKTNIGQTRIGKTIYENCTGKYITWLDGDDYWTYKHKLQTQVDFLESHPDYAGCFHDAEIICTVKQDDNKEEQAHKNFKYYSQFNRYRTEFHPWDLLERNIIPTASLIFRNKDFSKFFETNKNILFSLNWFIHLYSIKGSKFYYFNETWSVYTDHSLGISKRIEQNLFKRDNIKILKKLLKDDYYREYHRIKIYAAILYEQRQILYNSFTYKKSFFFFMQSCWLYTWYTLMLHVEEQKYFAGRFIKRQ